MMIHKSIGAVNRKDDIMVGVNPLADRKHSFSVIAVRCNSEESAGKRKLVPGKIYCLLDGYDVEERDADGNNTDTKDYAIKPRHEDKGYDGKGIEKISEVRKALDTLYDDYLVTDHRTKLHVQVSAIVGQNGSGKSSLVEFMMRIINNFAAALFGEFKSGEASERLHFINGVQGDLWYEIDGIMYKLHVDNGEVRIFSCGDSHNGQNRAIPSKLFAFGSHLQSYNTTLLSRQDEQTLKDACRFFFYTIVSNYSAYAYNTHDFYRESDSQEKERLISSQIPDEKFDNEHRNWLHGLFHKNDGYQIPIVITPYRNEGNIDINRENSLAQERLITLLIKNDQFRRLNGHLEFDSLTVGDQKSAYDYGYLKRELNMPNLLQTGYMALRRQIMESWGEKVGSDLNIFSQKPYFMIAINYLVYKTLKVSKYYRQHSGPFKLLENMQDAYNRDLVKVMVDSISKDLSHTTNKIQQTLGYLIFGVYSEKMQEGSSATFEFKDIFELWRETASLSNRTEGDLFRSSLRAHVAVASHLPPPFLRSSVNVHDASDKEKMIDFNTLSSGERQLDYAVSSILYHLENLDSVRSDRSDDSRMPYPNIFIVLEEVELYFHPELQQEFVKQLLDGIKQFDFKCLQGIHILLVTHSPYVLSDIPKENVLALKKDGMPSEKKLKTFCGNIHDMLKDSFFLSHGSQGGFAKWEIGHLMACINIHKQFRGQGMDRNDKLSIDMKSNEAYGFAQRYMERSKRHRRLMFNYEAFCRDFSEEQLRARIGIVDEPLLRSILLRELNEAFAKSDEEMRRMRIAELKKEIERLEEGI